MAIVVLTVDQRSNIKNNARFQSQLRAAILEEARYTSTLEGTQVANTNTDLTNWAKKRKISAEIMARPLSAWVFADWLEQAYVIMSGMQVYDNANSYDEEVVITYMVNNNKFTELAGLVFTQRMKTELF